MIRGWWLTLATLVVAGAARLPAQRTTVQGVVTDTAAVPLSGARVTAWPGGGSVITDREGRFRLDQPDAPIDSLMVARIGYVPLRLTAAGANLIALTPSPVVLPAIVSVANRREQSTADIALPVLTMSREAVEISGALSLDRLLQEVPGLQQSAEPPARSTLMIRGIGGSRVLVMIDGEPVPGALIEDRDLSRISLSSTERVEVVKGPLAAIYGSEAIGGVINVVTRQPSGSLRIGGAAGIGSRGRSSASVEASSGGAVPWRATISHRHLEEISTQSARPGAFQRVWDGNLTARTSLGSRIRLRTDARAMRERQRWAVDGTMNAFNDNQAVGGWTEAEFDAGQTLLRARLSAQTFSHRYREAAAPDPYAGTGAPVQRERSGRLLLTATRPVGGGHTLDAGSEIGLRWISSPDRLIGGEQQETGIDFWLNDAWQSGPWLLTVAARQAWSSRWGSTFTPSVTAAWEPRPSLRLRGAVARGYRAPSFKETHWHFSNPTAGYEILGNLDLVPERSWQTSLGFGWQPAPGTVLDVEVYRNTLRDLIDFRAAGTTPSGLQIQQTTNIASAMTRGIDVNLQQRAGAASLIVAWSWLGSRDDTSGEPLPQRIPHSVRLAAERPVGPVTATITGRWLDATPATTGYPTRADFLAFDAAARLRLGGWITLRAGVDNLFDEIPAGWNAPLGRSVRLELQAN
ncbi:MAG TPA: TonB-dependent receptor [Gemmatimonadales bacterium]|nr:TonB-dependent receptor [Gemmatimonadales bacterium]